MQISCFCQPKAKECQQTIEHQEFVAEVVMPEVLGEDIQPIAKQGRDDADIRHQAVFRLLMGKESEDEEAQ